MHQTLKAHLHFSCKKRFWRGHILCVFVFSSQQLCVLAIQTANVDALFLMPQFFSNGISNHDIIINVLLEDKSRLATSSWDMAAGIYPTFSHRYISEKSQWCWAIKPSSQSALEYNDGYKDGKRTLLSEANKQVSSQCLSLSDDSLQMVNVAYVRSCMYVRKFKSYKLIFVSM